MGKTPGQEEAVASISGVYSDSSSPFLGGHPPCLHRARSHPVSLSTHLLEPLAGVDVTGAGWGTDMGGSLPGTRPSPPVQEDGGTDLFPFSGPLQLY